MVYFVLVYYIFGWRDVIVLSIDVVGDGFSLFIYVVRDGEMIRIV